MSFVSVIQWHAAPSILAIGFSVLLVLSLVAVEEVEMRKGRPSALSEG